MPKRQQCIRCEKPLKACHCHILVSISNKTKVVIMQHKHEAKHAINTAKLLAQCLSDIEVIITQDSEITLPKNIDPARAYLLFPCEDADDLNASQPLPAKQHINTSENTSQIDTLIVLDATWRKANKMLATSPELQALKKIQLHVDQPRGYTLRKAKSQNMLSTLEAIAHSLIAIEADPARYSSLFGVLEEFMQLHSRHIPPEHLAKMRQRI